MKNYNKTLLGILFLVIAMSLQAPLDANAAVVNLAWDRNPETDIVGYKVHYGLTSRNYSLVADVGNFTTCVIAGLATNKTYYFACTAYNRSGLESNYSIEISYTPRSRR